LERYLTHLQAVEGYSDRHRRRKEILWDSQDIDNLTTKRAFRIKFGWKIRQKDQENVLTDRKERF